MDEQRDRISQWLRGVEGAGACVRIEARHLIAGSEGGSVVATFERDEARGVFSVDDIGARLDSDAEAIGGVQRYLLLAYRPDSKTPRDRLPLRVDGGADGDPSSSEPPNLRGALAQQMRHNEAMMRLMGTMMGASMESMAKQARAMGDALDKANEERVEVWGLLRQLATHDREKATVEAELASRAKREDLLRDSLSLLVPAVMAKLLPSGAVKESAFLKLVESLTPEQRETVFGVLTTEQRVALGAVLESAIAKDEPNGVSKGVSSS